MSIEFQVTEVLPAPPQRVFQAMTNVDEYAAWMPDFVRVERVGDVAQGAGARWRETRKMFGRETTEEFEVTHYHPPSHLSVRVDGSRGTSGKGVFDFDYKLAQRVGGTEVRLTGRVTACCRRCCDGWAGCWSSPSSAPAPGTCAPFPSTCAKRSRLPWGVRSPPAVDGAIRSPERVSLSG